MGKKPYQALTKIGTCDLYLGDCAKVMPTLGVVDALVTDPPYGIGADQKMAANSGKLSDSKRLAAKGTYKETDWDSVTCEAEISYARRMTRQQIIFGGNFYDLPPTSCWLIWDKENAATDFADCEMAWTNLDKPVRLIRHLWNGMLRKGDEKRYTHPTQKPLDVMAWCLTHLPADTQSILDPFMGSGTTGIAALRAGKRFIGIERDPDYYALAVRRIQEAADTPMLDL